jgi:glycosyltransferase involved in cell wall biosynthesis
MRALIKQFGGKNHSWAIFGWEIARAFKKQGHEVEYFSTDGVKHFPDDLKENLIGYTEENQQQVFGKSPSNSYDTAITYTSMKNFPHYLSPNIQNKLGVWCYEFAGKNVLPTGFAKNYKYCDYLCPPSQFAKQVFIDSGIPENIIKVIPHGINVENYRKTTTIKLPTEKSFKIGVVWGQLHLRKNIPGLLEAYGKAFTNKDDVSLIIKAKDKPVKFPFDVSLKSCLDAFYYKYPQHAEVKVFSDFVDDMANFYRSIGATFTMSHAECFYFPAIEAMASGKLSIAPNYGGQLDFLNTSNSLLIDGKIVRADPKSMYWESKNNAIWFQSSIDGAVEKLRYAYQNYQTLNAAIDKQREDIYKKYDWSVIANQFISLCK